MSSVEGGKCGTYHKAMSHALLLISLSLLTQDETFQLNLMSECPEEIFLSILFEF